MDPALTCTPWVSGHMDSYFPQELGCVCTCVCMLTHAQTHPSSFGVQTFACLHVWSVKGQAHAHTSWVGRVRTHVHSAQSTDVHTCLEYRKQTHVPWLLETQKRSSWDGSMHIFPPFLWNGESCCLKPQNGQQPLCKTRGITASSCLKQEWGKFWRVYVVRFYVHVLRFFPSFK